MEKPTWIKKAQSRLKSLQTRLIFKTKIWDLEIIQTKPHFLNKTKLWTILSKMPLQCNPREIIQINER